MKVSTFLQLCCPESCCLLGESCLPESWLDNESEKKFLSQFEKLNCENYVTRLAKLFLFPQKNGVQIVFFLHNFSVLKVNLMTFTETVTVQTESLLKLCSYI